MPRPPEIFEARGLHVLPGVIDSQVHFREPGNEHKEDLESGSRAAVLGGVTGVFEMPNTAPPTTSRAAIADKLARAKDRMHCDYAFYVGATPANVGALAELERLPGVCGVKAFLGSSTGSLLLNHPDDILAALKAGSRRMAVHSEDEDAFDRAQGIAPSAANRKPIRSGVTPKWRARPPNGYWPWRNRQDGACMCCMSPRGTRFHCWPPPRISPRPRPRRSIWRSARRSATSGSAPMPR